MPRSVNCAEPPWRFNKRSRTTSATVVRVFTPAAVKAVRELASQGKSASDIADAIGSTPASVRVKCCQLKIQLSRRGRPSLVPNLSRHNEGKLVVYMRPDNYDALKRRAAQMHKSPVELAGMLLEAIASANIFEAVLDEPAE
jgi:hypothetical protein